MALTVATISGPVVIAPDLKVATYSVAFDSSYPTGGEAWDLSGDFDFVKAISPCVMKDADNLTHQAVILGGTLTAGSGYPAASVKLGAEVAGAEAANTTDLSGIDELIITVFGS